LTTGQLRKRIKLQPQSLAELLTKRYKWSDADARQFADFLLPMLNYDPRRRASAEQCLRHPWLMQTAGQRPAAETSRAPDPTCPGTVQQDSGEPGPQDEAALPVETPAADCVVLETKCDAAAAETDQDDDVTPTTVDANA